MEATITAPVFKKRSAKTNARKTAPPPPASSDSSSDGERDGGGGRVIKRRKTTGKVIGSSSINEKSNESLDKNSHFAAERSTNIAANEDATKRSNWFEDEEKATETLNAKSLLGTTRTQPKSFLPQNPNAPPKSMGPMKAPTNVRTITVTDYAPDVCKDYKKTGFCGFGDSCKFLHAREDYAAGWKLDQEWDKTDKSEKGGQIVASANRSKDDSSADDAAEAALLEKIPFACILCEKPYTRPIETKCGHYFCEACALARYKKTPNCVACGAGTNGLFRPAKKLYELLEKKRAREKMKAEQEAAEKEGE